jgi:hypothetical protein
MMGLPVILGATQQPRFWRSDLLQRRLADGKCLGSLDFDTVHSVWQQMGISRAPAVALDWPLSAAHMGVSVDIIFATSIFLLGGASVVHF